MEQAFKKLQVYAGCFCAYESNKEDVSSSVSHM